MLEQQKVLKLLGRQRKLLYEHIRSINNTIELYMYEREAIVQQLEEKLDKNKNKEIVEDCHNFIKRVIELRHERVMTWQKRKFELLLQQKTGGCSKIEKEDIWCRFLIQLVESWRTVVFSGTVHWLYLNTSFHPLLWTSSGLTGTWKLSTYIGFGSLRSVKVLKLMVKEA